MQGQNWKRIKMAKKKNIDQLNPKAPKGWMRTRLGSYIVEFTRVKKGKLTDKVVRVTCDRSLKRCFVSEPTFLNTPRRAISYAQSHMKKSK